MRSLAPNSSFGVFRFWNWKAALLSAFSRGALYLALTITHGWRQAFLAVLIEGTYRAITVGFYGALLQATRDFEPAWLSALGAATVLPVITQWIDYLIHAFWHTPNLKLGNTISLVISAFAVLFDWYAIRRGTLLVGEEACSLRSDLKALPAIFLGLAMAAVTRGWGVARYVLAGPRPSQEVS
jgi:hypothetical protein